MSGLELNGLDWALLAIVIYALGVVSLAIVVLMKD